jgi:mRNA interferase RelE/StbE
MAYRVLFVSRAERGFKRLSADVQDRIISQINLLTEDPRPAGAVKLVGSDSLFRVRVGDYRIIYAVEDDFLVVLIVEIGHRREIYRKSDKKLSRQFLLGLIKNKTQ